MVRLERDLFVSSSMTGKRQSPGLWQGVQKEVSHNDTFLGVDLL